MHLEGAAAKAEIDARDLTCPICMAIAEDPHLSSCCHRVFCSKDANPTQYDNGCPLCRQVNYSFQASPPHKAMLDKLTIRCECSERIIPEDYENHLERCSNVTFSCPHSLCREKNDTNKYNSQQLVNHLARAHCDEVPFLGSTYVNKKSLEPYKKISGKYDDLVSTLYSSLYPKMIDVQLTTTPALKDTSPIFKCPQGHPLADVTAGQRKRHDGSVYTTPGFNCDICHRTFAKGQSWHCSCSQSGFDKCISCVVFQLYDLDDDTLQLASQDNEQQQQRFRRRTTRNTVRLPRGLFRLLTGSMEDDDSDDHPETLALRQQSSLFNPPVTYEGTDDDEIEVNLRED